MGKDTIDAIRELLQDQHPGLVMELDKMVEGSGWRPIATVPRNEVVDLWGFTRVSKDPKRLTNCWHEYGEWRVDWINWGNATEIQVINPTHWMPLPKPPREKKV